MSENKIVKSILTTEQVQKHFSVYRQQMSNLEKGLTNLSLENQQQCDLAVESLTKAKNLVKVLDEISKDIKGPYQETVKQIESYFRKFAEPLNNAIKAASGTILNFKEEETRRLKNEQDNVMENLNKEFQEKRQIVDNLKKIANSSLARIFGGIATIQGAETVFQGLQSLEDCKRLRIMFEEKYPQITSFNNFAPTAIMIKELALKALNEIESLLEKKKPVDYKFLRSIYEQKIFGELTAEEKKLTKDITKSEKEVDRVVKSALKGTRKEIRFNVSDINKVPINYIQVNEIAVKNYISVNRDAIKARLDAGDEYVEVIGGIKFYYDKKVVG